MKVGDIMVLKYNYPHPGKGFGRIEILRISELCLIKSVLTGEEKELPKSNIWSLILISDFLFL